MKNLKIALIAITMTTWALQSCQEAKIESKNKVYSGDLCYNKDSILLACEEVDNPMFFKENMAEDENSRAEDRPKRTLVGCTIICDDLTTLPGVICMRYPHTNCPRNMPIGVCIPLNGGCNM